MRDESQSKGCYKKREVVRVSRGSAGRGLDTIEHSVLGNVQSCQEATHMHRTSGSFEDK